MFRFLAFFLVLNIFPLAAQDFFPQKSSIDQPDPLASPYAMQGGTICEYLGPSPKSLNYYLDNNTMSAQIFGSFYESLLEMNSQTLEYDRCLAENGAFPKINSSSLSA